jgi:hypothetical protein
LISAWTRRRINRASHKYPGFPSTLHLFSISSISHNRSQYISQSSTRFPNPILTSSKMPPKAQKTPTTTAGKAPAGKAPAEKKEAGKKTAAPSGEKKKRTKSRKETYSSYIYKGEFFASVS